MHSATILVIAHPKVVSRYHIQLFHFEIYLIKLHCIGLQQLHLFLLGNILVKDVMHVVVLMVSL